MQVHLGEAPGAVPSTETEAERRVPGAGEGHGERGVSA